MTVKARPKRKLGKVQKAIELLDLYKQDLHRKQVDPQILELTLLLVKQLKKNQTIQQDTI